MAEQSGTSARLLRLFFGATETRRNGGWAGFALTASCDGSFAMPDDRRTACRVRRYGAGLALASGAFLAAMVGLATAHADDVDDLLSQAGQDLTQGVQALEQVPATSLDAGQAAALATQETIQTGPALRLLDSAETFQAGLSAADQTNPLLLSVDQQLVQAYAGLLDADQGFLAAAQAGDLGVGATALPAELSLLDADLAVLGADFNVGVTDLVATFDPAILTVF